MLFVIVQDNGSTVYPAMNSATNPKPAKGSSREASSGKIEHMPIEGVATGMRVKAIAGGTDQCIKANVISSQARVMRNSGMWSTGCIITKCCAQEDQTAFVFHDEVDHQGVGYT